MNKNTYWVFNKEEIAKEHIITARNDLDKKDGLLTLFKFIVKRYKDKNTKREQIEISAMVQDEHYGTISTDLINMETDIVKFRSYGVILDRLKCIELCKLIMDNYYYFEPIETENVDYYLTEEKVSKIMKMFCQYIIENDIRSVVNKSGIELYHVNVNEFKNELMESQYRKYGCTNVKEKLREVGFTHCNEGRNDYVAVINGRRTKVVSFYAQKVKEFPIQID